MFNLFNKKQFKSVDVDALKDALSFLDTNPRITFDPYPSYDGRIFVVLNSLGIDDKYMENSERITGNPIETMTLEDLRTMYTLIRRAERFCDGAIAGYVEDGSLAKMVKREIALLE